MPCDSVSRLPRLLTATTVGIRFTKAMDRSSWALASRRSANASNRAVRKSSSLSSVRCPAILPVRVTRANALSRSLVVQRRRRMRVGGPDREYRPLDGFHVSANVVYRELTIRFGAGERSHSEPYVTDASSGFGPHHRYPVAFFTSNLEHASLVHLRDDARSSRRVLAHVNCR